MSLIAPSWTGGQNALGADGWEFEKLLPGMSLHGEKDGHLLIFKRQRP